MRKYIPPAFLFTSLLFIYLGTIAPGLTWANDGADGGDFISAAATGGIPHPAGYPVYLLLARLIQFLPIGSLAFRTNLLSVVAALLAVMLVYAILVWLPDSPVFGDWIAGMIAGYAFGLSPLFWSQAVITEVYTLNSAFAALSIYLAILPVKPASQAWLDRWRGLMLGLAAGNNLTAVFLIPPVLLAGSWIESWKFDRLRMLRMCAWLGAGLLVYLILPIRAISNPPVNWGNPVTLRQFAWLVTGELYKQNLLVISSAGILLRLQAWFTLVLQQFELPGVFLGLAGLIYYFKPNRLYFITIFNAIIFSIFAIIYTSFDSYVYLLPVFLSISIWIGLGIGELLQSVENYSQRFKTGMIILFACLFLVLVLSRRPIVDAAHDLRAEEFGKHVIAAIPQNAIVFADGDRAIFALWYFHFALKQRQDLAILVPDLLQTDWYGETIRKTYPLLHWPTETLWPENITKINPDRPVCDVNYIIEEVIICKPIP